MQEQFQEIYVVKKKPEDNRHNVLFQCGTSLYYGCISLEHSISISYITLIPNQLRKVQEQFSLLCEIDSGEELEQGRLFLKVQDVIHTVCRFISSEIASDLVLDMMEEEMMKGDEQLGCEHYFELVTQILPKELSSIDFFCAKTYHRGECLALFYLEGVFYCQILRGEKEKNRLPDIKFPDIHQEGKGLTLKLNDRNEQIEGIL